MNTETLLTRVPPELKDAVVVIAHENDRSTSAEVRRALAEHVERARAGTPHANEAGAVEVGAAARAVASR